VKDENGDLLAYSHNILKRWKNYFSEFLNVHVSDVRQIEVHMAEPLVPGPSRLEVEIAIAKLKMYKLPISDQIPVLQLISYHEVLLNICTYFSHLPHMKHVLLIIIILHLNTRIVFGREYIQIQ
jgi:hypothetical protein